MRKVNFNRAMAGLLAVVMTVGQIPTPALAEAAQQAGQAAAGQGAVTSGDATGSDSGSDTPGGAVGESAVARDVPTDASVATGATAAANDTAAADEAAASAADASAVGQTSEQGSANDVAVQAAGKTLRFHVGGLTKGALKEALKDNFDGSVHRFRKVGDSTWTYPATWVFDSGAAYDLAAGEYEVQYQDWGWKDAGRFSLSYYWNATVTTSGAEGGAVVVDGTEVAGTYQIDDGATKTFAPKAIADYKVSSVKINGVEATANEDGSYTIPSNADSTIEVEYKADDETVVTVLGDNLKSVKVGGNALGQGGQITVSAKTPGSAVVAPDDGYAVTGMKFDGTDLDVTYANHVATAVLPTNIDKTADHTLEVATVKAELVKKGDEVEVGIAGKPESDYASIIFAAAIDADASEPKGLTADDVTIEYDAGGLTGWKGLDYSPSILEKWGGAHAFSADNGASEKIRITYKGNDQYPSASAELTINVVDGRAPTCISMNSATSVQYNADFNTMKQAAYNQLSPTVVNMNTHKPVNGLTIDDFEISGLTQTIGEKTVTVKFKGNSEYQPNVDEATATVTVTKAPSSLKVKNANVVYGDDVNISDIVSSTPGNDETKPVTVIAGIDGDGKGFVSVDFSNVVYHTILGDVNVQQVVQGVLGKSFTVGDLRSKLDAIKSILQTVGLDGEQLESIMQALEQVINIVDSVPGLSGATIQIGGTPSKAGVYLVGSVTSSECYETSVAVGYLTIAPKKENVKLSWNAEIPEDNFAYNNGDPIDFDFSAKVMDGDTDVTEGATVKYRYAGTTYSGEFYIGEDAPTEPGHYSESAWVLGGNYRAKRIERTFKINRTKTVVALGDENHEYDGATQTMDAVVQDEAGNPIEGAQVSYTYFGVNASGKFELKLSGAPKNAGTYKVVATYLGDSAHAPSISRTATLYIAPRPMEIRLNDKEKISGEEDPVFTYETVDVHRESNPWQGAGGAEYGADQEIEDSLDFGDPERDPGEEPGEYAVRTTVACSDKNFKVSVVEGKLTILPSLTVSVDGHGQAAATATGEEPSEFKGGAAGTVANIAATPDTGYVFTGWSVEGDATVADPTAAETTVTMGAQNATVTARFAMSVPITPAVKVTTEATEGGSVSSNPTGAVPGTVVTITATPDDGYVFDHWEVLSGDVELADMYSATTTFVLGEVPPVIKAHFKRAPEPTPEPTPEPGSKDPTGGQGTGTATTTTAAKVTKASAKKQTARDLPRTGDTMAAMVIIAAAAGLAILGAGVTLALKRRRQ